MAYDYAMRLHAGAVDCHGIVETAIGQVMVSQSKATPPDMETCEYLNISICPATESNNVRECNDSTRVIHLFMSV